jgi:hypothetical protein
MFSFPRARAVFSRPRNRKIVQALSAAIAGEEQKLLVESGDSYVWRAGDWMHEDMDGEIRRGGKHFSNGQRYPHDPEHGNQDSYDLLYCRCSLEKSDPDGNSTV